MSTDFRPIFIVGVGRSGTSLLQSMLNAHSCIAFPPETHFVRRYITPNVSWAEARKLIPQDPYLNRMQLDLFELADSASGVIDFYKKCMRAYMNKKGKSFIGDKDPKNIENILTIRHSFPGALIVHIYRDPRAVIASRLKAEWSKDSPLYQHILAYKAQHNYMVRNAGIFTDNYVEVKYEDLLTRPRKLLTPLLGKLGLEFEPGMLEYFKHSDEVVTGNEKSWKANVYNPVMKENISKWKSQLSTRNRNQIEAALYPEMRSRGYAYTKASMLKSRLYKIVAMLYCRLNCK
ncbi:MAG: sulfotransferase [Spirochaetaceae bacterium]|nr:sulfotransferase [Spirochaetaceae bacterium]